MNSPRLSIVIPNWNGAHHLPECLDSLVAQDFRDFETFLIEDASTDGSLELLQTGYPWVKVIRFPEHRGFAASCNAGIDASQSEFILLLNNDTRCEPDFLSQLVRALDEHPEASFAAAKMLRYDPPHVIDSAGDMFDLRRGTPRCMGEGEPGDRYVERAWVFGACAGAAIYRRSLFEDIGTFDEDFYFSSEDVDIDFRALLGGHRCLYVPEAVVYHKRGVSTHLPSVPIRALAMRNRIWAAGRSLPPMALLQTAFLAAIRFVRWCGWRVKRRLMGHHDYAPGDYRTYKKELWRALTKLPRKRREVQRTKRISSEAIMEMVRSPRQVLDRER